MPTDDEERTAGEECPLPTSQDSRGITLPELLVVLTILGVLASLALPTFRSRMLAANRADAREALLSLATAQEKFYLSCNRYAALLDPDRGSSCDPPSLRFPLHSHRGLYAIAVETADAAGWSARVTAAAGTPQTRDSTCAVLRLDSTGTRTSLTAAGVVSAVDCWAR
jgi:type IV pilus assembly protein PilE